MSMMRTVVVLNMVSYVRPTVIYLTIGYYYYYYFYYYYYYYYYFVLFPFVILHHT